MISVKQTKLFCCEDISKIEGYNEAIKDKKTVWCCHHKLGLYFDKQWLIDNGLYYNQRAEMLVFMSRSEHLSLHWKPATEETRSKISTAKMGHFVSSETKKKLSISNSKRVFQYTTDGAFIAEYNSPKDAEEQTGVNSAAISYCCRGKNRTSGGFVWSYTPIEFTKIENKNKKKICQLTLDGTLIRVWDSASDVEKTLKLYHTNVANCCKGKHKTCGGFRWCYLSAFNQ